MNDKRYFGNIHRIEEIISRLDKANPTPAEAKKLVEEGRALIEECDGILNSYSGMIESMSMN